MVENCCDEPADVESVEGVKILQDFINHTQPNVQVDLEFFAIAKHMRKGRFQQYRPTNPVNSIQVGDFISAIVHRPTDIFILPSQISITKRYFAVLNIVNEITKDCAGTIWLMVKLLKKEQNYGTYYNDRTDPVQWLQLNLRVRKVGKLHACTDKCITTIIGTRLCVQHDKTNKWILLSGQYGFPPHMA